MSADEPTGAGLAEALFPSPQLRAIPSFSFDYPAEWEMDDGTTALAAVHPSEPVEGFWTNVLVNHSRVPASLDLEQAAVTTFRQLRRHSPDVRILTERVGHFDGGRRETYLRIVETAAPDDGRAVTQLHALFFAPRLPGARTADLFQIVGSVPSEHADDEGPRVLDIVQSFRFESGPRT